MADLTADKIVLAFGVLLVLIGAYNTFAAARKNVRAEKERHGKPTNALAAEVNDINRKLGVDKLRLDGHDEKLADLKAGLMVTCAGVQALLEHELHNGNADEMTRASLNIDTWLRERG